MPSFMNKKSWLIGFFLSLVLVIGYQLRVKNSVNVPLPGQSLDEYSNAWVGLSLIRLGVPVGISGLSGIATYPSYINPDRVFSSTVPGGALAISYPWFDHPPLMGLVSGSVAYLRGDRVFEDVSTATIRKPIIWLSTLNIALIFLLAYLWFSPLTAVLAALLYATSPLAIVGGRMFQAENGLVPMWLISLCLLALAEKYNKTDLIRLAAFFAGLAVLFKLSGVVAIISGVLIIRKRRDLIEFLAISISIALLFVFYGLAIDGREFIAVLMSNAERTYGIGLNAVYDLITSTKITSTKYLTDGWPLVGWLALGALALKRKLSPLVICLTSYLAIYLLFGSVSYGWYRIPFLPFLFIAAGYFLAEGITGLNPLLSVIVLLIPLGINLGKIFEGNPLPWLISIFRFGTFGLILLALTSLVWPEKRILSLAVRAGLLLLLVAAIASNIVYAKMIDVNYWYKVN